MTTIPELSTFNSLRVLKEFWFFSILSNFFIKIIISMKGKVFYTLKLELEKLFTCNANSFITLNELSYDSNTTSTNGWMTTQSFREEQLVNILHQTCQKTSERTLYSFFTVLKVFNSCYIPYIPMLNFRCVCLYLEFIVYTYFQ